MTAHLSDRRRIERLLLVSLFAGVVRQGARDPSEPDTAETLRLLDAVAIALLDGADLARRATIGRRLETAAARFDRFRKPGTPVAEFGLLAFHFAKILIDRGVITIGAESDLSAALDRILPALAEADVAAGAELVAEQRAWHALGLLRADGYFLEAGQ